MQVTPNTFEDLALEVFRFQARENLIFHKYLQLLKIKVKVVFFKIFYKYEKPGKKAF